MHSAKNIILVNSISPRKRSFSDNCLENGISIIVSYLKSKGVDTYVVDHQNLTDYKKGLPPGILKLLRFLYSIQLYLFEKNKSKAITTILFLITSPVQRIVDKLRWTYLNHLSSKIITLIKQNQPLTVGFKLWHGDAYKWAKITASQIKRNYPNMLLIAGGPHASIYGKHILDDSDFDILVVGEGEYALYEIIKKINPNNINDTLHAVSTSQIQNTIVKSNGGITYEPAKVNDISSKTISEYSKYQLTSKILIHPIIDGLGCPWSKCYFCAHPSIYPNYKARPVEKTVKEMAYMLKQGIGLFRFCASDTPVAIAGKLAKQILEHDMKVEFAFFSRAIKNAQSNQDFIKNMYKDIIQAGLRCVFIGAECGNNEVNIRIFNKNVTDLDIIYTIKSIRLASVECNLPCSIILATIYPPPGLNREELKGIEEDNLRLVEQCEPDSVLITPPGTFPNTQWYDKKEDFGIQLSEDYIKRLMSYEYVLYKPRKMWPKIDIKINNMTWSEIMEYTDNIGKRIAKEGYLVNMPDEEIMMANVMGYFGQKLKGFKREVLLDILSGDDTFSKIVYDSVNQYSKRLAYSNDMKMLNNIINKDS
ncbi:MAG: cobalamin-dependent protein [Nitrospirae bacterium]|nr:cobalamin-dependent protein [Nitrospirota bacterium]